MSLKRSFFYSALYQIVNIIAPIITLPYVARTLGQSNIGVVAYTGSYIQYFLIFASIGIAIYGNREIALVKNYIKKRSIIFFELFTLKLIATFITLPFYIFSVFLFANDLKIKFIQLIFIGNFIVNALDISWFYMGLEEFKKISIRNFLVKISALIFIFLYVKSEKDIYIYVSMLMGLDILSQLYMWKGLDKKIIRISLKEICLKKHMRGVTSLLIPLIITVFYMNMDKIIIGNTIGKSEVALYDIPLKLISILITLVNSVSPVMLSRLSSVKGNKELYDEYISKSFKYLIAISMPMSLGIMVLSNDIIALFFGSEYSQAAVVMSYLSMMIVANAIGSIMCNFIMIPLGYEKEYRRTVYLMALIYLLLDIILIPKFGIIGAAVANMMSHFLILFYQFILMRQIIRIRDLINYSKKYFIFSIIMYIVLTLLSHYIIEFKIINKLLLKISVGVLTYTVLLLIYDRDIINETLRIRRVK